MINREDISISFSRILTDGDDSMRMMCINLLNVVLLVLRK